MQPARHPWAGFFSCVLACVLACTLSCVVPIESLAVEAAVTGTGGTPAASEARARAAETPVQGGSLVLGSIGEPSNLNPYISADSASHEVAGMVFVAPLRLDKNLELELWAAKRAELSEDGKRLVIELKPGILWEDGKELTAEDLVFTVKLVQDPKTGSPYAEDFLRIASIEALNRYTVEVRYDEYYARALASFTSAILPKHVLEGQDVRTGPFARNPLGAGPFRLASWKSGENVIMAANPSYFEGRPYMDEVVYRLIPDTATMFMELKAGRIDLMNLTPEQYLRQTTGPWWEDGFAKYRYLASAYTYMGFNMRHPFFQDRRVRWAISLALDRAELVKGALLGQGVAAFGPYKPGTTWYHPDLKPVAQNLDRARELLAESGFSDPDGDGILNRDGQKFEFTILTNQGNQERILCATIIQAQLKKIGIRVAVRSVEWAAFLREFVNKGAFDAVILGWTITPDPDLYQVWHSSQAVEGGLNFTFFKNVGLDRLLERGRVTRDDEERLAIYREVQEILHEEQPYCFLYVPYALPVVRSRVRGIEPALAGISWNMERWWLKPDRPVLLQ